MLLSYFSFQLSNLKILRLKATVSIFLFCALVQTVVLSKLLPRHFREGLNISKSHYCAVVPWWLLCLHVVIMDSTNCSQNYQFSSLFLHIFQIHIITSPSSVQQLHFMLALPCTGLVQFIKNSHYLGAELSVRFSVNLFKALLAIVARRAIFFSQGMS